MKFTPYVASALAPLVVGAGVPLTAFAVDYMTVEQAQKLLFPTAESFEIREVRLDAIQMQSLPQQYGVSARSAVWKVWVALKANVPIGYVVVDNTVGKFELITYAVAIGNDGIVKQVEILSYRESHGGEIRLPAWRQQFVGKAAQSPIKVGQDIANISGATLSCSHVAEGVKRIVAVMDVARKSGTLRL